MALGRIALCATVGVLSVAHLSDARLHETIMMKPRNAAAEEYPTISEGSGEVPAQPMNPIEFTRNLFETAYLSKLLFAAQHGITVPMQSSRPTNPIDLINNVPFPFNLVTEGMKRAATLAGVDLDSYRSYIENAYKHKVHEMITLGIIPQDQEGLSGALNLDIPNLSNEMLQGLKSYLPIDIPNAPSIPDIMEAFRIPAGSPAETTLRTLIPFFNFDALKKGMENENVVREAQTADPIALWAPFLDTSAIQGYFEGLIASPLASFAPLAGLSAQLGDLNKLFPLASSA